MSAYVCVCVCGRVSPHFQSIELLCCCMLSAALVLVQQNRMCGGKEGGYGRKQKRGGGGEAGVCLEGAVCHCESAQGGSHHLAIDGYPSPVVKQAPVGLPEHCGHCVPPSQETYHPNCCYPHYLSPTASPILLPLHLSASLPFPPREMGDEPAES